ncbi:MAG: 50S ribosomal protein L19 [Candidatus Aminicenantes bacterium]|nr:MAG: 50S ribosomal protein L19 [Candidatus Aminicenantes bacterium]
MVDAKKEKEKETAEVQDTQTGKKETENINKEEVEAQTQSADVTVEAEADSDVEDKKTTGKEDESPKKSTIGIGDLSFLSEVRTDLPEIKPGDVVRVFYRVVEGGKERTQIFEGTVIAIKNRGIAKTITVRKTSFGIAVERIFPLNSKLVQKIEIKKHSKVRRAKLYYLRELKGKAARLKELR